MITSALEAGIVLAAEFRDKTQRTRASNCSAWHAHTEYMRQQK
jgi:hypothetical protein